MALSESDESQRTTYTWLEGWGGGEAKLGGGASKLQGGASSLLEEEGLVGGLSEGERRPPPGGLTSSGAGGAGSAAEPAEAAEVARSAEEEGSSCDLDLGTKRARPLG